MHLCFALSMPLLDVLAEESLWLLSHQTKHTTQDPTLAEDAGMAYGVALYAQQPSGMLRLHMLARLVWRSVLLWGLLIALVTVTHWVS